MPLCLRGPLSWRGGGGPWAEPLSSPSSLSPPSPPPAAERSPGPKKAGERGAYCFWPTLSLLGLFYVALFFYFGPTARKILFLPEEILKDSRELGSVPKAGGVSSSSASSGVDPCLVDGRGAT